jgi:hypothetical protein
MQNLGRSTEHYGDESWEPVWIQSDDDAANVEDDRFREAKSGSDQTMRGTSKLILTNGSGSTLRIVFSLSSSANIS